jgi:methylated-DNA-protein-cysteine methyltransferase related protein
VAVGLGRIALADSHRMDRAVKKKRQQKGSSLSPRRAGKTPAVKFSNKAVFDESAPDKVAKARIRIEAAIRSIPPGKVSTYGAIARAARLPGRARQVAQVLHRGFNLPWQRVLGAGGEIKLRGDSAIEQRLRLEAEGVRFRGRKVDMKQCEYNLPRVKTSK